MSRFENRSVEDVAAYARQAARKAFEEKWGIDPGTAGLLFDRAGYLTKMLNHLDKSFLECLREENDHDTLLRNQGSARVLRDILGIPDEIKALESFDLPQQGSPASRRAPGELE